MIHIAVKIEQLCNIIKSYSDKIAPEMTKIMFFKEESIIV